MRGLYTLGLLIGLVAVAAGPAFADSASMTLTADANFVNLLKGGTTPFTATVGNLIGATDSLDWTVSNNGAAGLTLSGSSSAPLSPGATVAVTGSYTGAAYGTYSVSAYGTGTSHSTGDPAINSPVTSNPVQINVGQAVVANSGYNNLNAFDPNFTLSAMVAPGGSYAGLASRTTAGGGVLGTEAVILGGTNTDASARTITMTWRTRAAVEIFPTMTTPPIVSDGYGLISDVVSVTGLAGTPYVVEMSFEPNQFTTDFDLPISWYVQHQDVYVAWLDPSDGMWKNAVYGNSAGGNDPSAGFQGVGAYNGQTTLGDWGVDLDNDQVWAVLDHSSQLSALPEPVSMTVLVVGSICLLLKRRHA